MADRKAVIKNADMSEEMQQDAVDCATQALEKYNIEKVRLFNSLRWLPIVFVEFKFSFICVRIPTSSTFKIMT